MKVLYDYQIFNLTRYGGISRYFVELINAFEFDNEIDCEIGLLYSDNINIINNKCFKNIQREQSQHRFLLPFNFKGKARIQEVLTHLKLAKHSKTANQYIVNKILSEGHYDVFHPTYFDKYFLKNIGTKPFVITIYDMIHELYAGIFYKHNDAILESKKTIAKKANKIIAISENTKNDISRIFDIDENKIQVTYLASRFDEIKEVEPYHISWQRYILYVGDRHGYKNFMFFVKSIYKFLLDHNQLMLVCAGGMPFTKEEIVLFENLKILNRVVHEPIYNDLELIQLYQKAICFVYPSLYEGFGIPILESFSCDCPAVLSNLDSFNEVAGDAAIYFDPMQSESILSAIQCIMFNQSLQNELILKGRKQKNKFSWEKCARETKEIYLKIL